MSSVVLLGTEVYLGNRQRADVSSFNLAVSAAELDNTTFAAKGSRRRKGGTRSTVVAIGGPADVENADDIAAVSGDLTRGCILIPAPSGAGLIPAGGDTAYVGDVRVGEVSFGESVGGLLTYDLTMVSRTGRGFARGPVLRQVTGAVTASASTARQIPEAEGATCGFVVAVYARASASGGTFSVTVNSANNPSMSSPTTRLAVTSEVLAASEEYALISDEGLLTDADYWQAVITTTATIDDLIVAVGAHPSR